MPDLAEHLLSSMSKHWTISKEGWLIPSNSLHMALIWKHVTAGNHAPTPVRLAAFFCAIVLAMQQLGDEWTIEDIFKNFDEKWYDAVMDIFQYWSTDPEIFRQTVEEMRATLEVWLVGSRNVQTEMTRGGV